MVSQPFIVTFLLAQLLVWCVWAAADRSYTWHFHAGDHQLPQVALSMDEFETEIRESHVPGGGATRRIPFHGQVVDAVELNTPR